MQNKSPLRKGGGFNLNALNDELRILAKPLVDLAGCLVLGITIALLNSADQLLALALDHLKVVIGQLGPVALDLCP